MSSDSRWTGGLANREWQSGTRAQPTVDADELAAKVAEYLADCRKFRRTPSERGALTMIQHHGSDQKTAIVEAFRQAVSGG